MFWRLFAILALLFLQSCAQPPQKASPMPETEHKIAAPVVPPKKAIQVVILASEDVHLDWHTMAPERLVGLQTEPKLIIGKLDQYWRPDPIGVRSQRILLPETSGILAGLGKTGVRQERW